MAIPQTEVLITVDGTERGRYLFAPGEYILGRNADCHIPVEADLVSRRHAKLTINFDHAFIEDLGSSNGTQVNGQPAVGNTRLWPNQKIQVGAATIELHRRKVESTPDMTVTPTGEVMKRVLPEAFLREKKYDIGGVVAQGGMGAILNAKEATTERTVAMKVMLNTNSPDDLLRFLNEAKITGQLEHPNIVPVHELNVDENDQVFYTMKMVKGITLKKVLELLAEGVAATVKKYPLAALLTVFQKVCDALAFAHSKSVIHRDLKPENIMIGDYGEVLLMDWGLAKVLDPARATASVAPGEDLRSIVHTAPAGGQTGSMTLAGTVMGTPQFMSPEQARGEVETLDARSDIYALGAILYQVLSLRVPVTGTDAWDIVGKVGRGEIEPLECGGKRSATPLWQEPIAFSEFPKHALGSDAEGKARPNAGAHPGARRPSKSAVAATLCQRTPKREIPDSLAAVVRKAMAFDREARYRSVPDLQKDIEAFQNGFATSAENAGVVKQVRLLVLRHKGLFTTAFAAWAIITALAVWFVMNVTHERKVAVEERTMANKERGRAEDALTALRKTAPQMRQLAESEANLQHFDSALEKLDVAIALDPSHLPGYWRRAWLLLGMERFPEAADAIRLAQQKDPANAKLATILPVVEQVAAAPAADRWTQDRASAVLAHVQIVGASGEAVALSGKFKLGAEEKVKLVTERLKHWFGKEVSAFPTPTGGIQVYRLPNNLDTTEPLRGLPITDLSLSQTGVSDLEPLRGMALRSLNLGGSKVADLSPLRGMPLEELTLGETFVTDLSPLEGMQLRRLEALNSTKVRDLAPLHGMPLEVLILRDTAVEDLSPLKGMPLRELDLGSIKIKVFSPLKGMPLKKLIAVSDDLSALAGMQFEDLSLSTIASLATLRGLTVEKLNLSVWGANTDLKPLIGLRLKFLEIGGQMTDLSPLLECAELEELKAMNALAPIEPLRAHKTLKIISYSARGQPGFIKRPVEQFWKEYDAQQAAGKK